MDEHQGTCRRFAVSDGAYYHRMREALTFALSKSEESGLPLLIVLNAHKQLNASMLKKILPAEVHAALSKKRDSRIDGVTVSVTTANSIKLRGWPLDDAVVLACHLTPEAFRIVDKNLFLRTLVFVPWGEPLAAGTIETEIGDGDERLTSVSLRLPYDVALKVSCNRTLARQVLEEMAKREGLRTDPDDEWTHFYLLR